MFQLGEYFEVKFSTTKAFFLSSTAALTGSARVTIASKICRTVLKAGAVKMLLKFSFQSKCSLNGMEGRGRLLIVNWGH